MLRPDPGAGYSGGASPVTGPGAGGRPSGGAGPPGPHGPGIQRRVYDVEVNIMKMLMALCCAALLLPAQERSKPAELGVMVNDLPGGGLLITSVFEGSNAEAAGVRVDDVILEFNGRSVTSIDDLKAELKGIGPGSTVKMTVSRGDARLTLPVAFKAGEAGGSPEEGAPTRAPRPRPLNVAPVPVPSDRGGVPVALAALKKAERALEELEPGPQVQRALAQIAKARKALGNFGLGGRSVPEPGPDAGVRDMPDLGALTGRVRELYQSGASPEEIHEVLSKEFPGVTVQFGGPEAGLGAGGARSRSGSREEDSDSEREVDSDSDHEVDSDSDRSSSRDVKGSGSIRVRCSGCKDADRPCASCRKRAASGTPIPIRKTEGIKVKPVTPGKGDKKAAGSGKDTKDR